MCCAPTTVAKELIAPGNQPDQLALTPVHVSGGCGMIAKAKDITIFVGLMIYVGSISCLFRIAREGETDELRGGP
jgi:hypothetical protein